MTIHHSKQHWQHGECYTQYCTCVDLMRVVTWLLMYNFYYLAIHFRVGVGAGNECVSMYITNLW